MNRLLIPLSLSLSVLLGGVALAQEKKEPEFFYGGYEEALEKAKEKSSGLLLMYCWAEDDDPRQWDQTMTSEKVITALGDFICYSAKKGDGVGDKLLSDYKVAVTPTMLFIRPDRSVEDVLTGFVPAGQMLDELKRVREGKETVVALRKVTAAQPDDLDSQLKLATKLRSLGDTENYKKCADAILGVDPKARTEQGAMVKFWEICDECFRPELTANDVELKPMKDFVVKQKNKRALFLGYDRLAATEYQRALTAANEKDYEKHLKAAVTACKRAWKVVPKDEKIEWGARVAYAVWNHQRQLSKGDQKFALKMAQDVVKAFAKVDRRSMPNYNQMMAWYKYTVGLAFYVIAKRKDAIATLEECVVLDSESETYQKTLDGMKAGNIPLPKGFQGDG